MADKIVDAVVSFGTDTEALKQGLARAEGMVKGAMISLAKILGPAVLGIAARRAFTGYVQSADALGKFADSIGENVSKIDAWGLAVKQAGGTAEGFRASVDLLAKGLNQVATTGKGRAKVALDAFGISAKDATGKTKLATELLMELAGKAETMSKEQFRGLAQTFGLDKGTIMLLQQGKKGVQELVKEMEGMAITKEDAEIAARFNTEWQNLTSSFQRLTAILFRAITPAFTKFTKGFRAFVDYMRKHEFLIKTFLTGLAVIIMSQVVPAFIAWAAAMLINPITWIVIALALLALVIEDLVIWANGGKSAIKDFLIEMGVGEDTIKSFEEWLAKIGPTIKELIPLLSGAFWSTFAALLGTISGTIEMIVYGLRGLIRLLSFDFTGAWEDLKNVGKAGDKTLRSFFGGSVFDPGTTKAAADWRASQALVSAPSLAMSGATMGSAQNISQDTTVNIDTVNLQTTGDPKEAAKVFTGTVTNEVYRSRVNRVGSGVRQ